MTQSWPTLLEFDPPLVGCVVSANNFSFAALRATRECVLNIPTVEFQTQVVDCGNTSGRSVDKFSTCALAPVPAQRVAAPLIADCFANLECRVVDTRLMKRYNFFAPEVLQTWKDPGCQNPRTLHHRGGRRFQGDG